MDVEVSWEIAATEDVVNSIKEQKCPKSNRRRYNWSLKNLNLIKNQGELFSTLWPRTACFDTFVIMSF